MFRSTTLYCVLTQQFFICCVLVDTTEIQYVHSLLEIFSFFAYSGIYYNPGKLVKHDELAAPMGATVRRDEFETLPNIFVLTTSRVS